MAAELCNWSCLINNFYKDDVPNPHVHILARPRHRQTLVINNRSYTDDELGTIDAVMNALNLLSDGGVVIKAIRELPWNKCCSTVIDRYGVCWWIGI